GETEVRAEALQQALAEVGLNGRLRHRASSLSAGERQRLAIARALVTNARLILVDEPTARLDRENSRDAARLLLRAAHERRFAVVCATHDRALIELADEVLQLELRPDGRRRASSVTTAFPAP